MNPVILIPARLASTRLPEKPLADLHGAPMIVHVWRRAAQAGIGPVYVACDDARIAEAVKKAGGDAVMTRSSHPSGSDRIWEALSHIDPAGLHDIIVNVQGDVPTIEPESIRAALAPLADPAVDIATLACAITDARERSDPAVVKPVLVFRKTGVQENRGLGVETPEHLNTRTPEFPMARALYFSRAAIPHGDGPLYHHIGIYAYRRAALERFVRLPPSPLEQREKLEQLRALEAGMRIDAALVNAVPLGVDTEEHLERAREIIGKHQAEEEMRR